MDEKGIQDIPYIFKEKRPARAVEREHLAVSTDVIACSRCGGYEKHGTEQSQHNHRRGNVRPVPADTTLEAVEDDSQHSPHDNHRVEANQPALEEIPEAHRLAQAVVVGIADDKSGEDKEEIHSQIAVVDGSNQRAPCGKRQSLEYMVENHQEGSHTAQAVENLVMRFRVRESSGRNNCFRHGYCVYVSLKVRQRYREKVGEKLFYGKILYICARNI